MRLAEFIINNVEPILQDWENFARSLAPGTNMAVSALRDDAEAMLRACVRDMRTTQSLHQQARKSTGHGGAEGVACDSLDDASAVHGVGRVGSGFNLNEVVAEYRALRASVLSLWRKGLPAPDLDDLEDVTRFNESLDQSLAKAVAAYTHRVEQSRRMFLAILGHDLRNPLSCISLSAQVALARHEGDAPSCQALAQIETSVEAIARLVQDLLDFAATGLGGRMPIEMGPVDLEALGREVLAELQAAHPDRLLALNVTGYNFTCDCDSSRMRQVLSNLLGNALQHGAEHGVVELSIKTGSEECRIAVRNEGLPIPADVLPTIFDPLVRGASRDWARERRVGSIGLGLYIAREIIASHNGAIDVESSAESGTVFSVRLPRTQTALQRTDARHDSGSDSDRNEIQSTVSH